MGFPPISFRTDISMAANTSELGETGPSSRAEARRTQILDAASRCFREYGFHAASISRISAASGMSPGHIYHYFKNKEEIIAAIVEHDVLRILDVHERLRTADDVAEAMIACVGEAIRNKLEPDVAALRLEILAEAARNPRIAELVKVADIKTRASLHRTLRALANPQSDAELSACGDMLCILFDGLTARGVRNPDLDLDALEANFKRVVRSLLQL